MSDRIASFSSTTSSLNSALALQAKYNKTSAQSSSGLKSENYSGIASDSGRLLDLQSQSAKLTTQVSVIGAAKNRIDTTQDVTNSISDLLNTITSQLTAAQDGSTSASGATALGNSANTWKNEIAGLLNTKYAGTYLFGGSVQTTAPVDLSDPAYTPTTSPTTADTDYYQGDSVVQSVRVSSTYTLNYGVKADNSAFENIFRALSILAANPSDKTTIEQASDLIKTATNGVADITANLSSQGNVLSKEIDTQNATLETLNNSVSDLRDVDITATQVQLKNIETQLEASYSTLTTLLKLRLSDYLR